MIVFETNHVHCARPKKPEKIGSFKNFKYEKFGPKGPINLIYSTRQEQYLFLVDFENLYNSLRSKVFIEKSSGGRFLWNRN
jgi:hypothetical protein